MPLRSLPTVERLCFCAYALLETARVTVVEGRTTQAAHGRRATFSLHIEHEKDRDGSLFAAKQALALPPDEAPRRVWRSTSPTPRSIRAWVAHREFQWQRSLSAPDPNDWNSRAARIAPTMIRAIRAGRYLLRRGISRGDPHEATFKALGLKRGGGPLDMRALLLLACAVGALGIACASPNEVQEERVSNHSKIVGGTTAPITAWPGITYLAAQGQHACGATLVADRWVVTASHCIGLGGQDFGIDKVVIGRQDTTGGGGEVIPVAQITKHPNYDEQTNNNDIALVKLARPSSQPKARIVSSTEWSQLAKIGAMATVVGWGATSEGGQQSTSLLQADVSLVATAQCSSSYDSGLTQNMVCAGGAGKDSCQGDSGGPLFMNVDGAPVQVGIVSFGNGCARASFPGVYTRLANYLDWLSQTSGGEIVAGAAKPPVIEDPEETSAGDADTEDEETSPSAKDDDEDSDDETPKKQTQAVPQTTGCAVSSPGSSSQVGLVFALVAAAGALGRRRSRKA